MSIFPFLTAPIWLLLVISFYPRPGRGWRGLLTPYFGGIAVGMITLSISLGLLTRTPFGVDLIRIYPWAWYRGPGWPMVVGSALLILLNYRTSTAYSRIRLFACWLGGTGTVHLIWVALSTDPGFDSYRILLAPIVWIAAMGITVWLLDRAMRLDGWVKILILVCAVVISPLITFIPILQAWGYELLAWIIGLILAFSSTFLFYLDSRGRFN